MPPIVVSVNGHDYPPLERNFINKNLENAADVTTLDNSMYTDFVSNNFDEWRMRWDSVTEAEYAVIRADYDAQFTDFEYPILSIPYYSVSNVPARMYINEKNIYNNCGSIEGLEVIFRETSQLVEVS